MQEIYRQNGGFSSDELKELQAWNMEEPWNHLHGNKQSVANGGETRWNVVI